MKNFCKKIVVNARPISQIIIIVIAFLLPIILDFTGLFTPPDDTVSVDIKHNLLVILWSYGNIAIGFAFSITVLFLMRKFNKDVSFNHGNTYKDYPFFWYWFCSKVLGYKKCNLVLVPIHLQFKLVLNDTFKEYFWENIETHEDIKFTKDKRNMTVVSNEINIVIADTYPIEKKQLPQNKKGNPTIWISRDKELVNCRYYSNKFVDAVINAVKENENTYKTINIFATTNPESTFNICRKAIKSGDRSSFDKVIVFQQDSDGIRKFKPKGKTVYKR